MEHRVRAASPGIRVRVLDRRSTSWEAGPNGEPNLGVPHILNVSIPGIDSEAAILALRGIAAISNGSACTSASYEPSHVLTAMGLDDERQPRGHPTVVGTRTPFADADRWSRPPSPRLKSVAQQAWIPLSNPVGVISISLRNG